MIGDSYEVNFNSSAILRGGECRENTFPCSAFGFDEDIGFVSISIHKQILNLCLKLFL